MGFFRKYLKVAPLSHALWRCLEAEAFSEIKIKPPVLDLGCGFGEFVGVAFDRIVETGIDINPKDLVMAAEKGKYKKLILADARSLPFDKESFGSVVSISTLEHIEGVGEVFREVRRVLKRGGKFVFTVPTASVNENLAIPAFLRRYGLHFASSIFLNTFHWSFKHKVIIPASGWLAMVEKEGFKVKVWRGTISKNQLKIFEFFLPLALPTQFFKFFFKKRLPVSPDFRVRLLNFLFKKFLKEEAKTDVNIIVVAQKP